MLRSITSADEFKDKKEVDCNRVSHLGNLKNWSEAFNYKNVSRERGEIFFFLVGKRKKETRKKEYTPQTLFRESLRRGVKEREAKEEEEEEEEDSAELSLCGVRREDIKHKTEQILFVGDIVIIIIIIIAHLELENDVLLLYHQNALRDDNTRRHHLCPIEKNRRGATARPTTEPPPPPPRVWSTKKRDDDDNNNNNNMYERAECDDGRWEGQGIGRRHRRGSRDRVRRRRSERPRGGVPRIEPDRSRGETVRGEQRARERGRDAFGMHDVVWHRSRVDGCRDDGRADGERKSER